jgi:hypothetical protein
MNQGDSALSTPVPASQDTASHINEARALDEAVGRLLSGSAPPSSRSILAGILGAAAPVSVLAHDVDGSPPHPDQHLLDTEAELVRATAAAEEASSASSAAHDALWKALGPCPTELVAPRWIIGRLGWPGAHPELRRRRLLQWVKTNDPDDDGSSQAWTGNGLRSVIEYAVPAFGTGGQTPHRIREWKALLPVADAFDGRRAHFERLFRVNKLSDASRKARDAEYLLSRKLATFTASTVDGLGAITRHIGTFGWEQMPSASIGLLLSVAKVTGVDLGIPEFDVERWAGELHAVGGRISPPNRYDYGGVHWPVSHNHTPEQKATIARLSREQQEHKIQVRLFVERGGLAA